MNEAVLLADEPPHSPDWRGGNACWPHGIDYPAGNAVIVQPWPFRERPAGHAGVVERYTLRIQPAAGLLPGRARYPRPARIPLEVVIELNPVVVFAPLGLRARPRQKQFVRHPTAQTVGENPGINAVAVKQPHLLVGGLH